MESEQKDREYNFPFDYEIQYVIKNLHEEQLIQSILDKLKEHLINKSLCELYECFLLRLIEVSDNLYVISKYILELCKFEYKNYRFEKKKRFEIKEQVDKKEGLKYVIVRHALAMDKQIKRTYDGGYRYWMDVSKQYYSFDDSCAHIYLENCNDLFDEQDRKNLFDVAIMHFEQSSLENAEVQMSSYVSRNATIAKFYREHVSAVYKSFIIEIDENLADCLRAALIHREALMRPVAGCTELFELSCYPFLVRILPSPYALKELITSEVIS